MAKLKPLEKGYSEQAASTTTVHSKPLTDLKADGDAGAGAAAADKVVEPTPTTPPEGKAVEQAVQFLEHPRTALMPLAAKRAFLVII